MRNCCWKVARNKKMCIFANEFNSKTMNTIVDIEEKMDVATIQDDLTPEQRARWEAIIEQDLRDIAEGKPKKYLTLDEFEKKLIDAVHTIYA